MAPSSGVLWQDHANELSRHYRERDHRLLEDLPALQQPGGTFAAVQDSGGQGGLVSECAAEVDERSREAVGGWLTLAVVVVQQHKLQSSSRGLDVLVLAHEDGRVVLLLSGLFPVLHVDLSSYLPQQHPPSSASSSSGGQLSQQSPSRPSIRSVCATGDLSALLFAVQQQQPTTGSSSSSSLVTVRTPSLWRYRHEVAPLADMFSSLSALVGHVHDAIDLAEKQWKERWVGGWVGRYKGGQQPPQRPAWRPSCCPGSDWALPTVRPCLIPHAAAVPRCWRSSWACSKIC